MSFQLWLRTSELPAGKTITCWISRVWQRGILLRNTLPEVWHTAVCKTYFIVCVFTWMNISCPNPTYTYVTLDHKTSHKGSEISQSWINMLSIDAWFVMIAQYLAETIWKSGFWGCKKIKILRKSSLKLSKWRSEQCILPIKNLVFIYF